MGLTGRHSQGPAATEDVVPGNCMYGYHPIPASEPYIRVSYSRERFTGADPADVDYAASVLFACMRHAPSEEAVLEALRSAGMPA